MQISTRLRITALACTAMFMFCTNPENPFVDTNNVKITVVAQNAQKQLSPGTSVSDTGAFLSQCPILV